MPFIRPKMERDVAVHLYKSKSKAINPAIEHDVASRETSMKEKDEYPMQGSRSLARKRYPMQGSGG